MKNLVIFHYHLLPGGVTNVIYLSSIAMIENIPGIEELILVCGRKENSDAVRRKIINALPDYKGSVKIEILEEIDYLMEDLEIDQGKLRSRLLDRYSGKMWIIHNYHLGKNPIFTDILLQIAKEIPDQKMIFYIHDFPECSRYANLQFLRKHAAGPFYPVLPNIRYLVINARDRKLLVESGLPEPVVFLVHNPVEKNDGPHMRGDELRARLAFFNGKEYGEFHPELPVALYPVRAIRRKNVLESALLCLLSESELNLIVTLPGVSLPERSYSELTRSVFFDNIIPGLWGIGEVLDQAGLTYRELLAGSDIVVSSSVQEGFGYLFIDSLQFARPLFAKYLDILEGFKSAFPDQGTYFYDFARVPLSKDEIKKIAGQYKARINALASFLAPEIINGLLKETDELCGGDFIDFSFLSKENQYYILRKTRDSKVYRDELRQANKTILKKFDSILKSGMPPVDSDGKFSFVHYAQGIADIEQSFYDDIQTHAIEGNKVQENLIKKFASLEYLRLIYK